MTKGKRKGSAGVERAAEAVGHALGSVAGTIDSLQAQHPHPVQEAREAIIRKAKAVARRTKKVTRRARRKSTPAVDRMTGTARKVVKRVSKAIKRRGN